MPQYFTLSMPFKPSNELKHDIEQGFKLLTIRYNTELKKLKKRYDYLIKTQEYEIAKREKHEKRFWNDNNFTKYGFQEFFKVNYFKRTEKPKRSIYDNTIVNSKILQALSIHLWRSFEKLLDGKGKDVHIKKISSMTFIGLYQIKYNPQTHSFDFTHRGRRNIISQKLDIKTDYEFYAFENPIKEVTIKKQIIRGKEKYFFHICFNGTPYNKGRELGTNSVGIDPSMLKMFACYSNGEMLEHSLIDKIDEKSGEICDSKYNSDKYEKLEKKIGILQAQIDKRLRMTNKKFFDENGQINEEAVNKAKLKHPNSVWKYSKTAMKMRNKVAQIKRNLALHRKECHFRLANYILSKANTIKVENNSYKSFQARAKETTYNANGRPRSKKRFGKPIQKGAPKAFITILKNKAASWGDRASFSEVGASEACTQFDHTSSEFTKHELKERVVELSNGDRVHRDFHAAMNILFFKNAVTKSKKGTKKNSDHFDIEGMREFYNQHRENMIT